MSELADRLEAVLAAHLPGGQAGVPTDPNVPLRDRGIDSLALVGLMMDIELEFDIIFPDNLMTTETFHSAGALADVLAGLLPPVATERPQ